MKRALDLAIAVPALVVTSPVIGLLAAAVKLDSVGGAFFRHERVGRNQRRFEVLKLRTMVSGAHQGVQVTGAGDSRVTRVGRLLRATKLDELPQLWNVVRGDMSIVGPRPEAPAYVVRYQPEWDEVFSVRPGITDLASIVFRDEERLLAGVTEREEAYVRGVLPAKVPLAIAGVREAGVVNDVAVIARTVRAVLLRGSHERHPAVVQARAAIAALEHKDHQT